jgi:hypothetical protein
MKLGLWIALGVGIGVAIGAALDQAALGVDARHRAAPARPPFCSFVRASTTPSAGLVSLGYAPPGHAHPLQGVVTHH